MQWRTKERELEEAKLSTEQNGLIVESNLSHALEQSIQD